MDEDDIQKDGAEADTKARENIVDMVVSSVSGGCIDDGGGSDMIWRATKTTTNTTKTVTLTERDIRSKIDGMMMVVDSK